MGYLRSLILCCILSFFFLPPSSHACTTFCLDSDDALLVGKNFDWTIGEALIIVNKRNVAKTSHVKLDQTEDNPISWTSTYGSVTFNPWGREFPFSGMNEAGLVVSGMGLGGTIFPDPDERPAILAKQWIQYQLDNFTTVEQVIASDSELRINDTMTIHFFVCDSTGTCATIEFIDGGLVYHTQDTLPVKVLTNGTYASCLESWEKGEIPQSDPAEVVQRFFTAAQMMEDYDPAISGPAVDYTFTIMSNLDWWVDTQWSIAYDVQQRRINFHTLANGNIRYFDMSSFDFSCQTPVKVLDIHEDVSGDISDHFIDYTFEINRDQIEKIYVDVDLSDEVIDAIAGYPETTVCAETCKLDVKYRKIKSKKLFKPRKRVLHITGSEGFDPHAPIDLGPLEWRKMSFKEKKNRLKIFAIVPEDLGPGPVPISVGDCTGSIEIK